LEAADTFGEESESKRMISRRFRDGDCVSPVSSAQFFHELLDMDLHRFF